MDRAVIEGARQRSSTRLFDVQDSSAHDCRGRARSIMTSTAPAQCLPVKVYAVCSHGGRTNFRFMRRIAASSMIRASRRSDLTSTALRARGNGVS